MAREGGFNSTLGIIALVILVALVVYFVMDERDDDLEIDIGTRDVPVLIEGTWVG